MSRSILPIPIIAALIFASSLLADPAPPNFIFILADDQGWNALSVPADPDDEHSGSQYFQTPNLAKLAGRGMRFSQAYSPAPTCSPSRYALQWGRSPVCLGIFGADGIKRKMVKARTQDSMANLLKARHPNYACAHFGKWHIAFTPEELGYEFNDGSNANLKSSKDPRDPKFIFSLTQKATSFISQQVASNRPFFLQLSHYADHLRYEALPETVDKYKNELAKNATQYHRDPVWAAMNENLDTGIGILLDKIKELGIENNTYVIYTADNGYESKLDAQKKIDQRGYYKAFPQRSHKYTVSEGGIRVPFIVAGPGVKASAHSGIPVVGNDVLPTILDLAGASSAIPESVEGVSLRPLLSSTGKDLRRPDPFLVFKHSKNWDPKDAAIVQGNYKYLKSLVTEHGFLYNLADDVGERNDLSEAMPERAAQMDAALAAYFHRHQLNAKKRNQKNKKR